MNETPYLSIPEAADFLRISKRSVRRHIKAGILPHCKLGGRILLRRDELMAHLPTRRNFTVADVLG